MNILLTSAGRRSYLVQYFKEALKQRAAGGGPCGQQPACGVLRGGRPDGGDAVNLRPILYPVSAGLLQALGDRAFDPAL